MISDKKNFIYGMRDGLPIAVGYFAVSFTLGIQARAAGLTALEATVMSLTNLTSAGEFAALTIIIAGYLLTLVGSNLAKDASNLNDDID
jgi:predicted branched-subunit amino acid permease